MKTILTTLLIAFTVTISSAQNALELTFKKYKNNTDVTSLSFDDKIMDYLKSDSKDFKTKISKVDIIMFAPDKDFTKTELAKLEESVISDNYELLVNVRSKEAKAKIYGASNEKDNLQALYAQVYSEAATIYFMLKGDIYFDELSSMGLDFEGSEIFKNLSEKKEEYEVKNK